MDLSRDTFYRYKAAAEEGSIDVLFAQSRRVPNRKTAQMGPKRLRVVPMFESRPKAKPALAMN